MDSEDAATLASIARGDQAALAALYARYRPRLFRFLWQHVQGDAALVEEVLQDTFLAIWRAAATFRGEARVATWVFRIALRSAQHARRGAAEHSSLTLSLSELEDDGDAPTANGHEEDTLTRLTLHDALARLSDKQRAVVLLIFVQGFTAEEAAEILGVPPGTIKSRLRAARALLVSDPALQHSEEVNS